MFYWIYDVSTPALAFLISSAYVVFTWVGTILIRPFLRLFVRRQANTNDLIGYILSCYCVFYGLLLGLIAVAAYQNYSDSDRTVSEEAAALTGLYRDISNYHEPVRSEVQALIRSYTRFVIDEAWPLQRKGLTSEEGGRRLGAVLKRMAEYEPTTKGQEILHAEALDAFNEVSKLRRMRVFSVSTGIPAIMWYVVIVGSVLNIVIVWLFDMKLITHLFLGGMLAFFIGAVICLIAAMDNPFRGEVSIGPDAFENVYRALMSEQGPSVPSPGTVGAK